jgi:hypothetical protein
MSYRNDHDAAVARDIRATMPDASTVGPSTGAWR